MGKESMDEVFWHIQQIHREGGRGTSKEKDDGSRVGKEERESKAGTGERVGEEGSAQRGDGEEG